MQLNAFTDYSLRLLVYAAVRPDRVCSVAEVASAFGISHHHLVKVAHTLRRLGYLETLRGRRGGFRLAHVPDQIRIGEVVRRLEGHVPLVECFAEVNRCPLNPACGLKSTLQRAYDAFFAVLDAATLADVVAEPQWVSILATLRPHPRHVREHRTTLTEMT